MDRNYDVINIISKTFISKGPSVTKFPDIIKIATTFIEKFVKILCFLKELRNGDGNLFLCPPQK